MSNKTRYFVLTAGAILAIGLTTGLVASFMGLPVAFSRAAGPDELQYVPADAAVVAYANVNDVMNSKFRERFRKFEPDTSERDEFEAEDRRQHRGGHPHRRGGHDSGGRRSDRLAA